MTELTITYTRPDPTSFARIDNLIDSANMAVTNDATVQEAADLLGAIKGAARDFEAERKATVGPLNAAVKQINDDYRVPADKCAAAEAALKKAIGAYQAEQHRIAQEKEAKLRREQEAERLRLRQEAERKEAAERERARKAREKAEEAARKAEAAGRAERAEALRKQAEMEEQDRQRRAAEEAEQKRMQAEMTPAVVLAPAPTKVKGVSKRKVWKFRIVNLRELPDKYLIADETKIGKVVRALGDECDITGIEVYEEETIASRATA